VHIRGPVGRGIWFWAQEKGAKWHPVQECSGQWNPVYRRGQSGGWCPQALEVGTAGRIRAWRWDFKAVACMVSVILC
jgi:hypothetical protein